MVRYVPYIDIFEAGGKRHLSRPLEGLRRRRGEIVLFIQRIKTGEMGGMSRPPTFLIQSDIRSTTSMSSFLVGIMRLTSST
jgi:hypothetical protein